MVHGRWGLLAAVALWDVVAVLTPRGPLKLLVEEAEARGEPLAVHRHEPYHYVLYLLYVRGKRQAGEDLSALEASVERRAAVLGGGATDGWQTMSHIRWHYDVDGSSTLVLDEVLKGLDALTCCGANCPFASYCEREAYVLGFGRGFGSDSDAHEPNARQPQQEAQSIEEEKEPDRGLKPYL